MQQRGKPINVAQVAHLVIIKGISCYDNFTSEVSWPTLYVPHSDFGSVASFTSDIKITQAQRIYSARWISWQFWALTEHKLCQSRSHKGQFSHIKWWTCVKMIFPWTYTKNEILSACRAKVWHGSYFLKVTLVTLENPHCSALKKISSKSNFVGDFHPYPNLVHKTVPGSAQGCRTGNGE